MYVDAEGIRSAGSAGGAAASVGVGVLAASLTERDEVVVPDDEFRSLLMPLLAAERARGVVVRRVPFVPGTKQATLIGSRAYCMATAPARGSLELGPRRAQTLHAIDLESGKVVWQRPLGVPAQAR